MRILKDIPFDIFWQINQISVLSEKAKVRIGENRLCLSPLKVIYKNRNETDRKRERGSFLFCL